MDVLSRDRSRLSCPNCDHTEYRVLAPREIWFHSCRGLRGLTAPMVIDGTKAKIEARDRDDYVGQEQVTTDGEGRPVMSIVTTRDEGTDAVILVPTATVST